MKKFLFLAFAVLVSSAQVSPPGIRIVFVKNNNIFVTADGSSPRQITHDSVQKFLPVWSKDGSRILFNRKVDAGSALSEVVVIDENGRQLHDILVRPTEKAPPGGMRFVENVEWLSSQTIAVSGSVNPSLTETVVIDLKSGREVKDIYDDDGGPVFSRDGSRVAYIDGMPHFSPATSGRPTLNIDYRPIFPTPGSHVVFLTKPQWSADSTSLAVVCEDFGTKQASLVIWQSSKGISVLPLDLMGAKAVDVFWSGTNWYVKNSDRAWRVQDGTVAQVPPYSAVNPSEQAQLEGKKLDLSMRDSGVTDWDFWCQHCSLAILPRHQTLNK